MAQKSLIQLIQTTAQELSIPTPNAVISSNDLNVTKLLALMRATCDDILQEHDWQVLQKRTSFSTTSGTETYAWPADVERFTSGSFFDQNNRWPMTGPLTAAEWEQLKVSNLNTSPFQRYRVFANKIYLYPIPGATTFTFVYEYVSSSYVADGSSGADKADFTQDSDICKFDHRVVVYGTKLKWLQALGMDTTAAVADYNRALEFSKGSDIPAKKLSLNGCTAGVALLSSLNIPDTGFGV